MGHLHGKGVVIDKRVAFSASMNLMRSARTNKEVMFKMTGPVVLEFQEHLLTLRRDADQLV